MIEKWVSENTDNLMVETKETHRKFRNYRNDNNYLSWQQAAIAVEESMVNNKNNYLQQKYVEVEEVAKAS